MRTKRALFPALLRYWRNRCGMSQLDVALTADVSSRHVSFLETGRAQPSREMVLRLAAALRVPLRDRNTMLHAAGFEDEFPEPDVAEGLPEPVRHAIDRMLAQHEPFPLVVMNRYYDVQLANRSATRLLPLFVADPSALTPPLNAFRLMFDPRLGRPFVVDWGRAARNLLSRLQLEALAHPSDPGLAQLIDQLLEYPGVPETWRHPDFSVPNDFILTFRMRREELEVAFITTMTVFSAPGNVTLDELRIESYFPVDSNTEEVCKRLASG